MSLALKATPPAPTCTEHELVAAVRDGSDPAFEELYARYQSRISSYICGLVDDHARAEDIAQEVFISALRRLRVTERPIAFKAWIYEIAKNACIDEFRRTRRTREVPLEPEPGGAETDPRLVSDTPSPDAAIESKQSLRHLTGAFHGLSENHHRVIVMREFEGLSYDEIGERLGMTRPVVESTLFRARRRLSQEYSELVSGRRCQQVHALIAAEEPESLLKLGVRQRRQLARHLAHCQPCRRHARLAGVDDSLFHAPSLVGKIAAWLPIPWLWRRAAQRDGARRHGQAQVHPRAVVAVHGAVRRVGGCVDRLRTGGGCRGGGRAGGTRRRDCDRRRESEPPRGAPPDPSRPVVPQRPDPPGCEAAAPGQGGCRRPPAERHRAPQIWGEWWASHEDAYAGGWRRWRPGRERRGQRRRLFEPGVRVGRRFAEAAGGLRPRRRIGCGAGCPEPAEAAST